MRRLLLDTHIWLWYVGESRDLPGALREAIDESLGLLWLSPISIWEAGLLAGKGRIRIAGDYNAWVEAALEELPLREALINFEVAKRCGGLDLPHNDPADRLLAATAMAYDLTMVTVDRNLVEADWLPTLTAG